MLALHIVLLVALFVWLWRKFPIVFSLALLFKVVCGLGLGLLYKYYYSAGDTWTFYQDGLNAADFLRNNPNEFIHFFWFDDWLPNKPMLTSGMNAMFMVKWVTLFNLFTGDNYWLVAVYFSLLPFMGCWIFFQSLMKCYSSFQMESTIAVLFVPSVVFWSSGVIKECLALGALLALSGFFIRWYKYSQWSWLNILGVFLSLWVLWNLKYYWLAVWLAAVGPLCIVKMVSQKSEWVRKHPKTVWITIFCVAVVWVSTIHPNFYYNRILNVVVDNHQAYVKLSSPEDLIGFSTLEPTLMSVLKNAPWALISGFFRPFVWEGSTAFQVAAGIESLVLIVLFIMTSFRFKKWSTSLNELHLALIFYLIGLSVLLTLSTPNFGSLSRYRIGFTPFLWLILLIASGATQYLPKPIQNLLSKS